MKINQVSSSGNQLTKSCLNLRLRFSAKRVTLKNDQVRLSTLLIQHRIKSGYLSHDNSRRYEGEALASAFGSKLKRKPKGGPKR